jgi:hypothetical protein
VLCASSVELLVQVGLTRSHLPALPIFAERWSVQSVHSQRTHLAALSPSCPDAALLVPPRCTLHRRLPFRLPFSWGPGSSPAAIKVVMSTNGESPAPDAASDSRDPSGFLSEIIGAPVTVKLNSGIVYKGMQGRRDLMRAFSDIVR